MAKVNMADLKALRERSGAGLKDCKNALQESAGDMDTAMDWLRAKGIAKAAKKSSRIATEGMIHAFISEDGRSGSIVEVNCETDFVGKTSGFQEFVARVAEHVGQATPSDTDALKTQSWSFEEGQTVEEIRQSMVLRTGENVNIRRFAIASNDYVAEYIHAGSRLGVLLSVSVDGDFTGNADFQSFIEDLTMHIAANSPEYVSDAEIPMAVITKEKEIQVARAMEEGKPQNIAEKMVVGRINKWKKEISLLDQIFDDDNKTTVAKELVNKGSEFGGSITLESFVLYRLGEGMAKKVDNFAEEVAAMSQQ
jgi:elongation factor Ts